ncbi:DUF5684 domain-containing protein [Catalinimonas niigatensis]|uniref:DUF5684 domain-containing protein n=1 Tax=Catalinimonas niigatensis TaxID=1397264 RepID=UPI0026663CA8|nr:DUF5684 domain-containing protein [Catalinimonas niigatensis]WPP51079.1 DUF5684 domain-containing protein [Catalinimonas niigatensis]
MNEQMVQSMGVGIMIIYFALIILILVSMWKIFTKAGKVGWASIIPIYNIIILLEIIGKPAWWIILYFIPGVNLVFAVWSTNLLSKGFGNSEGFTIGMLFLPFVFYPVLAFGSASYHGPVGGQMASAIPAV